MVQTCNFCGKSKDSVKKIIVNNNTGICNNCVDLCGEILVSEKTKDEKEPTVIDPIVIKEHLDKFIVSQEKAKQVLSVAVANHYKRINSDSDIEKSNLMLIGPTGSGKTLMVKTIAKYMDVPYAIADATRLTENGFVGEDVDSILTQLVQNANGDIKKAEKGIVFIDEIDKISRKTGGTAEVGSVGVQQALLKMVEGTMFSVIESKKADSAFDIDTTNILFIASGAFSELDKIKKKKRKGTQIGFSADVKERLDVDTEFEDLIAYGMIPEFTARFPVIAEVEELSPGDMLNILTDVENNLVTQYKTLFDYNHVKLTFDKTALEQVVSIASTKKTGARGLRSIMEKALMPHMYNINKYSENNINKVRITKSLINNPMEVKKK